MYLATPLTFPHGGRQKRNKTDLFGILRHDIMQRALLLLHSPTWGRQIERKQLSAKAPDHFIKPYSEARWISTAAKISPWDRGLTPYFAGKLASLSVKVPSPSLSLRAHVQGWVLLLKPQVQVLSLFAPPLPTSPHNVPSYLCQDCCILGRGSIVSSPKRPK